MIEARAFAKLTLSLRVSPPLASGLHPVDGRFQSLDWADRLTLEMAEEDVAVAPDGEPVIDGKRNLAWTAVTRVRDRAVTSPPLRLTLDKSLPIAAGLGGGSADAAAALAMGGALLGIDRSELIALAPALGSDVPFCFVGGSARVRGTGERVDPLPASAGFAFGLVVPPIEVSTPAVYRRWDELEGPSGPTLRPDAVPPAIRDEPIVNDLTPAAMAVAPEIGEWRSELEHRWSRPMALAGSGPTLFAFFMDLDEAEAAVAAVPSGARNATAVVPVDHGWTLRIGDTDRIVDSKGRQITAGDGSGRSQ